MDSRVGSGAGLTNYSRMRRMQPSQVQAVTVFSLCLLTTWGSAPHPGSVACGAPMPRAAPSHPNAPKTRVGGPGSRARRRAAVMRQREQNSRKEPHNGLTSEGLRPSDSPTPSLAGAPCPAPLRRARHVARLVRYAARPQRVQNSRCERHNRLTLSASPKTAAAAAASVRLPLFDLGFSESYTATEPDEGRQ